MQVTGHSILPASWKASFMKATYLTYLIVGTENNQIRFRLI